MFKNLFSRKRSRKNGEMLCGGWSEPKNKEISPEAMEIFLSAIKDSEYADLEAESLIGTQVVAGINYKFLSHKNNEKGKYVVKIFRDLHGNCSVLSVEKYN